VILNVAVIDEKKVQLTTKVRWLENMERMLRRLIGESKQLVAKRVPELGPVKADPGQIGQVILNLVVSAT
jgi:signal transduction histidine kinase